MVAKINSISRNNDIKEVEPGNGQMILACNNNGVIHIVAVGDDLWKKYTQEDSRFGAKGFTHWMELPELPDDYKN